MTETTRLLAHIREGKSVSPHEPITWHCRWRVDKYHGIDLKIPFNKRRFNRGYYLPDDYSEGEGNLLMTAGATELFNGLITSPTLAWNLTNSGLVVGDSSTAAAAGQTDVQAAAGTKINAADPSGATNATPIVVSGTFSPSAVVGSAYVLSGFSGAGASAINQTFECSVGGAGSMTLLNSAGSGAITVTGALIKPINRYAQNVNGTPTVSTNTAQFIAVYGANNGNFAWQEFSTQLLSAFHTATTQVQQQPLTKMLNRAVASNGTKAQGSSWTLTETITLS